jgi:hypothetical protein
MISFVIYWHSYRIQKHDDAPSYDVAITIPLSRTHTPTPITLITHISPQCLSCFSFIESSTSSQKWAHKILTNTLLSRAFLFPNPPQLIFPQPPEKFSLSRIFSLSQRQKCRQNESETSFFGHEQRKERESSNSMNHKDADESSLF